MANDKINKRISKLLLEAVEKRKKEVLSPVTVNIIAREVVAKMKEIIAKGISTIQPGGRYPGYIGQGDPTKYPATVRKRKTKPYPAKKDRPVNLFLSGAFLKALKWRAPRINKDGASVEIGYFDKLSQKKEQGHREGANGQPSRPTIPEPNENFANSIRAVILDVIKRRL